VFRQWCWHDGVFADTHDLVWRCAQCGCKQEIQDDGEIDGEMQPRKTTYGPDLQDYFAQAMNGIFRRKPKPSFPSLRMALTAASHSPMSAKLPPRRAFERRKRAA